MRGTSGDRQDQQGGEDGADDYLALTPDVDDTGAEGNRDPRPHQQQRHRLEGAVGQVLGAAERAINQRCVPGQRIRSQDQQHDRPYEGGCEHRPYEDTGPGEPRQQQPAVRFQKRLRNG